jgi:hypothetical protein
LCFAANQGFEIVINRWYGTVAAGFARAIEPIEIGEFVRQPFGQQLDANIEPGFTFRGEKSIFLILFFDIFEIRVSLQKTYISCFGTLDHCKLDTVYTVFENIQF